MSEIIKGKAFVLGDNVDTDQIIPAEHLVYSISDPEEKKLYGKYALSAVPEADLLKYSEGKKFISEAKSESEYSIIIGGANFGCGSSREHAPFALQMAGVKAVVAEAYARIFYRNAVDGGFLIPLETHCKLNKFITTGDEVEIDFETNSVKNLNTGNSYQLIPLGDVLPIIKAGGLFNYAEEAGLMSRG